MRPCWRRYAFLSGGAGEEIELRIRPSWVPLILPLVKSRLTRDLALGRTTIGIHRDEIEFNLNGYELRRYGSQGQQKFFLIVKAGREFDFLTTHRNTKPLILLR